MVEVLYIYRRVFLKSCEDWTVRYTTLMVFCLQSGIDDLKSDDILSVLITNELISFE